MTADPDEILDRSMNWFMTRMRGRFDPDAPVASRWAQAVSAFLEPDTGILRRGQIDALTAWISQADDDTDQRWWLIALTSLCGNLQGMHPADAAGVRDDPDRLIALAEFYLHLDEHAGDHPHGTPQREPETES
jgi:hypothetical protein